MMMGVDGDPRYDLTMPREGYLYIPHSPTSVAQILNFVTIERH